MEFVFEFLFQVVFQIFGEYLLNAGFKGAAAVVRSKVGRYSAAIVAGFVVGVFWGNYLSGAGHPNRPRLFWVSLVVALVFGAAAAWRWRLDADLDPVTTPADDRSALAIELTPWRWPAYRLIGMSLLNGALAAGIATGWTPPGLT